MAQAAARGAATRTANMQIRRKRILDCARDVIAEDGFDALNLRSLADRAGVTVPTIYNLIGNKSALLQRLFEDSISPFEDLATILPPEDPLTGLEAFADRIVAMLGANQNYHRAEYLARQRLARTGDPAAISFLERSHQVAIELCRRAQEIGLTRGEIGARQLGNQMYQSTRVAHSDWAHGRISLAALRNRILLGTYLGIAADVTAQQHAELIEKIRALDTPQPVSTGQP